MEQASKDACFKLAEPTFGSFFSKIETEFFLQTTYLEFITTKADFPRISFLFPREAKFCIESKFYYLLYMKENNDGSMKESNETEIGKENRFTA